MVAEGRHFGTVVVVVRGWSDPVETFLWKRGGGRLPSHFIQHIQQSLPGANVLVPELDMGTLSVADPRDLVKQMVAVIDARFERDPFQELIIVAFSAGTLLARSLYGVAHGAGKAWASRVTRIVMVAGITRGWSISSATPANLRFAAPVLLSLVELWSRLVHNRQAFVLHLKRGAPFVIESRLKLLQMETDRRRQSAGMPLPHTVLLVGSKDEFVSPADAIDLGPRDSFSYIEVPASTHMEMLDVGSDTPAARNRAALLTLALTADPKELAAVAMKSEDIDDYIDELDRPIQNDLENRCGAGIRSKTVEKVIFVIHGIRDNGFWTKRVARELKEAGRHRNVMVRAPSPSYGYFSMWDFINPWGRRDAVYWFLEKYCEVRILYPSAKISYVGHSNGTFLAARALELCEMVELQKIVFAGSVVRTNFDWQRFTGRVGSVLNLVATRDWVVACLPGAFERLGLRFFGVGGAGFAGFREQGCHDGNPAVRNLRFLDGGHGVGISELMWKDIARFVVDDNDIMPAQRADDSSRPRARSRSARIAGSVAPCAPLILIATLVAVACLLVSWFDGVGLAIMTALLVILAQNIIRCY